MTIQFKSLTSFCMLATSLLVFGCAQEDAPTADVHDDSHDGVVHLSSVQESNLGIEVGQLDEKMMGKTIRANGMLQVPPQYLLSVTAPFGGRVKETSILPGDKVSKGATLIVLEDPEFIVMQQDYLTVSAELVYAEQELHRQQQLSKESVSARRHLEKITSDAQVLRVRKRALEEHLAMINIDAGNLTAENLSRAITLRAPYDGYVTSVFVNTGTSVPPNGTLLEMVDPTHMHVELMVFEQDAAKIIKGQKLQVQLSGEDTMRVGDVHLVGTRINDDRTVDVHGHLDDHSGSLRPGTTLAALITTDQKLVPTLPVSAVVDRGGETWVYIQHSLGKYQRVDVAIGISTNDRVEITSNLEMLAGKNIVVNGARRIEKGEGGEHGH